MILSQVVLFITLIYTTSGAPCFCAIIDAVVFSGPHPHVGPDFLGILPKGDCVPFLGEEYTSPQFFWAHVSYDGTDGFIEEHYAVKKACPSTATGSASPKTT